MTNRRVVVSDREVLCRYAERPDIPRRLHAKGALRATPFAEGELKKTRTRVVLEIVAMRLCRDGLEALHGRASPHHKDLPILHELSVAQPLTLFQSSVLRRPGWPRQSRRR